MRRTDGEDRKVLTTLRAQEWLGYATMLEGDALALEDLYADSAGAADARACAQALRMAAARLVERTR